MRYLSSFVIFLFLLTFPIHSSASQQIKDVDIGDSHTITETSLTYSESTSRKSAVKIETDSGYGSGTYVLIASRKVVITAAHVIDDSVTVTVVGRDGENVIGKVIYIDPDNDFAVISVPKMNTRDAVTFRPFSRDIEGLVGSNVFYSGYPNRHDLLTIRGSVAGKDRGFLIMQSYSWMGASGAGVFNSFGDFIGILVAVDIGVFDGSRQVVESVVWIVPISNIEMSAVEKIIRQKIPEKRRKVHKK